MNLLNSFLFFTASGFRFILFLAPQELRKVKDCNR